MRIRGWQIEGFGVFHDFEVRDLPRDFVLVHGPNEAGKSTLLGFLRAILFGFPDARSAEPAYPPLRGGRHGGALLLESEDNLYRVERTNGRRSRVSITRPDGSEAEASNLERLVGRADRSLFRSVFAFSLAELTELQSLSSDEVRARIFSAGIAGAGRSAREVVVHLDGTIERLLKPRGGAIRELVSRAENLQRQIREAARKAAEYPALVERENAARLEVERLRAGHAAAEAALRRAVKLVDLWPLEAERQRLSAALERLEGGTGPEGAEAALAETTAGENDQELNAFDAATSEIDASFEALGAEIRAAARDGCASERLSGFSSRLAATAGRIAAIGDPRLAATDESWRPRPIALDRVAAEEQRLARAEAVLEAARARLIGIAVDRSLDAVQPAIADVARQVETARQRLVQLRATSREREDLERAIEREVSDLGPGLDEEAAGGLRADLNAFTEIRRMASRMASAREECANRRRDLEHLSAGGAYDEQEIGRLESVLQGAEPPSAVELSRDAGAIRRLRAGLADMAEVQSRLEGAEALVRERQLALEEVPQIVQTPSWTTSAVVVLSLAAMVAAVWRGMSSDPGGSIALGLVAVAALAVLMVTYRSRVRAASMLRPAREARLQSLAQAEQQVTRLEERADGLRNRVAETAAGLGLGEGPTGTAIDRREETLERQQEERRAWDRAVEALGRAGARRDVWRQRMKEAESRLSSAAEAEAGAGNEWKEWKERSRLPAELDPERAIDYLERVRVVQDRIAMRDRLRRCETDLADGAAAWEARAKELLAHSGDAPGAAGESGESLIERIVALQARCSRDAERRHERALIASEIERWQAEAESARSVLGEALRQAAVEIETQWKRLDAAWRDGEAWRAARRAEIELAVSSRALSDARAKLLQEIERLEGKIEIATGRGDEAAALRAELALGRVDRWEEDKLTAAEDARRLQREHESAVRADEVLLQSLRALEEASDVAGLEMELQGTKSDIDESVRAWTTARLARAMVLRTLAEFERSRQPEVLATASDLMSRVTGGRYPNVVVGDDGESLAVVDRRGARRLVGQLSRGTAEQLYLCIRLGLAREFSRRVEPLPIVMDDVLVDFDSGRAERMALELLRFSKENQVLLFTCHDFTRDLVLRLAPGTNAVELPLEDIPEEAPETGSPERKKGRRRRRSC